MASPAALGSHGVLIIKKITRPSLNQRNIFKRYTKKEKHPKPRKYEGKTLNGMKVDVGKLRLSACREKLCNVITVGVTKETIVCFLAVSLSIPISTSIKDDAKLSQHKRGRLESYHRAETNELRWHNPSHY